MNIPQAIGETYREYKQGTLKSVLLSYFDLSGFSVLIPAKAKNFLNRIISSFYYRLLNFLLSKKHLVNGTFTNPQFDKSDKMFSLSYESILSEWVFVNAPTEHIITLENINVEEKNINFWARLPSHKRMKFLDDVVIFRCKDKSEMQLLVSNIPPGFATANGYFEGIKLFTNVSSEKSE